MVSLLGRFGGVILLNKNKKGLLIDNALLEIATDTLKYNLIKIFHDGYFNTDNDTSKFAVEFYNVVDLLTTGIIPLDLNFLDVNGLVEEIETEIVDTLKKNAKITHIKHIALKLSNEELNQIKEALSEMADFENDYMLDDDLKLKIKVAVNKERNISYINTSLYTKDDKLLVHNVALYDIKDLLNKGIKFGFNYLKSNNVSEITKIGKGYLIDKEINIYFIIEEN